MLALALRGTALRVVIISFDQITLGKAKCMLVRANRIYDQRDICATKDVRRFDMEPFF